jgi:hypothetical protein
MTHIRSSAWLFAMTAIPLCSQATEVASGDIKNFQQYGRELVQQRLQEAVTEHALLPPPPPPK